MRTRFERRAAAVEAEGRRYSNPAAQAAADLAAGAVSERRHDSPRTLAEPFAASRLSGPDNKKPRRGGVRGEWAIQDSNLGPLPYQRSALTD
jgi:hypothetical protein